MEDVLDVYARPRRPVVCMEGKPMQFLDESRPRFRYTDESMVMDYGTSAEGSAISASLSGIPS